MAASATHEPRAQHCADLRSSPPLALLIIAAVKSGEYPTSDPAAKRNFATACDQTERFDKAHIAVRSKANTVKEYGGNLRRFILSALGLLAVPKITRADVANFHHVSSTHSISG
jgi:hypothetical protein